MNYWLWLTSKSYRKHRWARQKLVELRRNPTWYELEKKYRRLHYGITIIVPKIGEVSARDLLK